MPISSHSPQLIISSFVRKTVKVTPISSNLLPLSRLHSNSLHRSAYSFLSRPTNSSSPLSRLQPHPSHFSTTTTINNKMSSNDRLSQLLSHIAPPAGTPNAAPLAGSLLKDQVAIITGAGQGIGRSVALLFATHGAKVVVSDLDGSRAKEVVNLIKKGGGEALEVVGNVMGDGFAEDLVKKTVERFGKINIIVNNAGFTNDKMLHTTDDATFRQMLEVHTVAPFRIIRAAAPYLRIKDESKRENRSIINISSTSGTHGNIGQINYSAAKSSVVGMTKTIAKEWGPFGVRANTIAYGWIDTRLTRAKESGESIEIDGRKVALGIPGRPAKQGASTEGGKPAVNAASDIPLGRPGRQEEAAGPVLFLASGLASYVSGQVLEVTGGRGI